MFIYSEYISNKIFISYINFQKLCSFLIVKLKIFFELLNLGNDQNINQEWKIFFQEFHDYFCSKKAHLSNSQDLKQGCSSSQQPAIFKLFKIFVRLLLPFLQNNIQCIKFIWNLLYITKHQFKINFYQDLTSKRVKERSIGDAYDRVQQWRYFFRNGIQENGIQKKVTLKEAADLVKVPKKTLEDYIQIFNKAELIINIEEISEKKMGFLRSFMKKNKSKIRKAMILQKQKKIEENLKKQNQEVEENNQQNKIEYEYESVTDAYPSFQNELSGNCDQDNKSAFDDYDDWEYSNQFFNKICLNHHFD